MDGIWRDLIGGGILMLTGSGRILRSLMDGTGWIAMGGQSDIIDGGVEDGCIRVIRGDVGNAWRRRG